MEKYKPNIDILKWALKNANLKPEIEKKYQLWFDGTKIPNYNDLEKFAQLVKIPFGYLFLPEIPRHLLELNIEDFRTPKTGGPTAPSRDLIDAVDMGEYRQSWYRQYALRTGQPVLDFVGSVTLTDSPKQVADSIKKVLDLTIEEWLKIPNADMAFKRMIELAEGSGLLVMVSSIVGLNTKRKLNIDEFRSFSMSDKLAPLIFINANDAIPARIFTLAHELAHIWLGKSGLANPDAGNIANSGLERWRGSVATELLVPFSALQEEINTANTHMTLDFIRELAGKFHVSSLVILRQLFENQLIDQDYYNQMVKKESIIINNALKKPSKTSGDDFYNALFLSIGHRFIRALVADTLRGDTLYLEATKLLAVQSLSLIDELAKR
ncbi:MAG: ImmA/IrrE family metallo-endopeptidase [Deltaproteobacteria bacterium]|jgi:Zn-dependent peptidase ImmA (M78 family)|nr:ImmA/IrrE family metallo-endopeptidase [Deltaproteobacteria bacterium]